ncbi:MAG: hypothetical protein WCK47_08470 [bacterium]
MIRKLLGCAMAALFVAPVCPAVATQVVLEDFTTVRGSFGEVRDAAHGVPVGAPTGDTTQYVSAPRCGAFTFDAGPATATEGMIEFYTIPLTLPADCTAFSWQCMAPVGFTYSVEVEDTSLWLHHASPRFAQISDGKWQASSVSISKLSPPLAPGASVANVYIRVYGGGNGSRVPLAGVARFDDFIFKTPSAAGEAANARLTGFQTSVPFKQP